MNRIFYKCNSTRRSHGIQSVSTIVYREQAEEIFKVLHINCNMRKHFGQILNFDFKPVKVDYQALGSVFMFVSLLPMHPIFRFGITRVLCIELAMADLIILTLIFLTLVYFSLIKDLNGILES